MLQVVETVKLVQIEGWRQLLQWLHPEDLCPGKDCGADRG
jgi:hypothetical protein